MNYDPTLPRSGFLTPKWVREYFKISNSTLYGWIAAKYICPPIKIGKRAVRFRAEDIHRFEAEILARDVKPS